MNLIPVVLAAMLAGSPPPVDRPTRPFVQVTAFAGAGLLAMGLGFAVTGLAGSDPQTPAYEWSRTAPANTVGGIALMSVGLCLITIAALLTPWARPSARWLAANAAGLGLGVRLP